MQLSEAAAGGRREDDTAAAATPLLLAQLVLDDQSYERLLNATVLAPAQEQAPGVWSFHLVYHGAWAPARALSVDCRQCPPPLP